MKPSPMPLFNYRKRERHALVSDPSKNASAKEFATSSNQTSSTFSSLPSPPSSTTHANGFDEQTQVLHKGKTNLNNRMNNTSVSFNSGNKSRAYNRPKGTNPPKPFPKTPELISHKPGVNNKRSSVIIPSQQFNSDKSHGQISIHHHMDAKRAKTSTQARGSSSNGRDRSDYSDICLDSTRDGDIESSNNNWSSNIGRGVNKTHKYPDKGSPYSPAANSFSIASSKWQRNSWPNSASTSSAPWENKGGHADTDNKPRFVKLQSGNVQPQFGMIRPNKSLSKCGNPPTQSHPKSGGRDTMLTNQFSGNTDVLLSIFDEEDVSMQPTSKYLEASLELDNSLRIFTSPIRDMQSWSKAGLYDGTVLFEIYGLIISGITDAQCDGGKEFYARDQSGTIRCTFYEIDRELPSLAKGQVHRLVGSMTKQQGNSGGGYFKVVSVRKADKGERSFCQQGTEASLNEMDKLARQLDKEQ